MAHLRAALHRVRSAARLRACSANKPRYNPNPNPNPNSIFSSSKMMHSLTVQKLSIHVDLANLSVLRSSGAAWCYPSQKSLFSSSPSATSADSTSTETISVTFVDKHGDEKSIKVPLGMSMLEAAHQNDIELEGACEGSIACSTCHVIVMDEKYYSKLPEPTDEENDMLDLAFGLTETSRLGCQVLAKPELEGIRLAIPSATRNFAVDGYVPKPH